MADLSQQTPGSHIQANAATGTSGAGATTTYSQSASAVRRLQCPHFIGEVHHIGGNPYRTGDAAVRNPRNRCHIQSNSIAANGIPLSTFAQLTPTTEALSINHQGQFPAVTVSFNLANRTSLGTAITDIKKVAENLQFPASLQADFQGTAASFNNSLSNEALLILAALVTVYIVLGVLYESFIHPITILSTLPSAGVGALLSLMLFHQDLNAVALLASSCLSVL